MKSGYTLYSGNTKLEITLDDIETVAVEIGDILDWEHSQELRISYSDFREFLKGVVGQFFDISGEN